MTEVWVISFLCLVVIAQNIFWARLCLSLTNRLMSRNYAELRQAEVKPKDAPLKTSDGEIDPESERQANELNSIMGMV